MLRGLICLLVCMVAADAAVEGDLGGDRRDRDDFDILQPVWTDADSATGSAEATGSAIIHVFPSGLDAKDGFWTAASVAASEAIPVVAVSGGLESTQAKTWGLRELPAVVAADWYGNPWAKLEGKAVKPAAVEALMTQANGLVTRTQERIGQAIDKAAAQAATTERKIPDAIATLNRFASLAGLPEAKRAQDELDAIVSKGLSELQDLARQMGDEPAATKRALASFERRYAGTPLAAQAARVKDGQPIAMEAPTPVAAEVAAEGDQADDAGGAVDLFGGQ